MKKFLTTFLFLLSLYVIFCGIIYLFQEKLIFLPQKLPADYQFNLSEPFEEMTIRTADGKGLNALLFKAAASKGVILYLHGNAGSLASWAPVAPVYTSLGYDVFLVDYRGYGKSTGKINNEAQLIADMQTVYDTVKEYYDESRIIILGYSLGSGPAAQLAAANNPRMLILQAAYYSLTDVARSVMPIAPPFLLKYPMKTYKFLPGCKMPVVIFHGTDDRVIPYKSALRLKNIGKATDTLISFEGLGHNGMTFDPRYQSALSNVLP